MNQDLAACENALGYHFQDGSLLEQALTHASLGEGMGRNNERLEFLGDAVLSLAITEHLYQDLPNLNEGEMTEIKGMVVSRASLASAASTLGLDQWIRVGRAVSSHYSIPRSILSNAVEALMGAIYLDGGYAEARKFCLRHLGGVIEQARQGARNYKMLLQNYSQKQFGSVPRYKILSRGGPSHSRSFQVQVSVNGHGYPPAWGKTKKEAEQWAAREALIRIPREADEDPT